MSVKYVQVYIKKSEGDTELGYYKQRDFNNEASCAITL